MPDYESNENYMAIISGRKLPVYPVIDPLLFPRPDLPARGQPRLSPRPPRLKAGRPPGHAPLLPPPLPPPRSGVQHLSFHHLRNRFKSTLNLYHSINKLDRNLLPQRVATLNQLFQLNALLGQQSFVDKEILISFMAHVQLRREYFNTLISYMQPGKKKNKIDELLTLFAQRKSRHVVKPRATGGEALYVNLHWTKILEKLDPFHREASTQGSVYSHFTRWCLTNMDQDRDPSENLVDFLLTKDDWKPGGVKYSGKEETLFSKLIFRRTEGKVYGYYVRVPDDGGYQYYRAEGQHLTQGLIPHHQIFHTIEGGVHANGEDLPYRNYRMRGEGVDLVGAHIYVMRDNKIFSYPAGGAKHSQGQAGKAVQTAGMIVADQGKIMAIDNKSGHYQPSWKHLQQAVELIHSNNAFTDDACVGVCYGEACIFFTIQDFRTLAGRNFPFGKTWDAVITGHQHVFGKQKFARMRALYTQNLDPDDYPSEGRKEFLLTLYPDIKQTFDMLDNIDTRRRTWSRAEFKNASKVWYQRGRGGLDDIDQALGAYDDAFKRLVAIWKDWNTGAQSFGRTLQEVGETFETLYNAVADWVNEYRTGNAHEKRWNAVSNLLNQLIRDKQGMTFHRLRQAFWS